MSRAGTTAALVVGGGPAGLAMAAQLGRLGVDCVLVERREQVSGHPRARSVNVRTAELFRCWGILDEVVAASLPLQWTGSLVYTETLAGREIGRTAMSVQPVVDGVEVSPAPWLLSSQDRIEPILEELARSQASVRVRRGYRLESIEVADAAADADYAVAATVIGPGSEAERIEARWLIAADGAASAVRRHCGIDMEGPAGLATLVNCHFRADLSPWTNHRPAALYWTTAPARNVFQKIDTADRWLCQIGYDPAVDPPESFTPERAAAWIRRSVGDEALAVDVLDVIPWVMSSTVAERFRHGPVFLVGDAAHQLPPSGGFGMNTAIQDTHNLAWKLAHVDRGWAAEALLDTYHTERSPVARYNAERSLENTRNVGRIRKLVERGGADPVAEQEAVAAAGRYGNWLGMDLGLRYEAGCLLPDGTEPAAVADPVSDYRPEARPGHRAPHVPLSPAGGRPGSTLDLYDDRFVLLTGSALGPAGGAPASAMVHPVAAHHPEEAGRLETAHGITPTGAVLVRPDGHVAWRQAGGADPSALGGVLHQLVGVRP
ncbi:MAG: FAD-dependent monooxygenase [Acidimicrobiales bacterium]